MTHKFTTREAREQIIDRTLVMPRRIEVNTREYECSHGKTPRGRGYWAFKFDDDPEPYWSKPDQLYSQALGDAHKLAVSHGASEITVCP